MLNSAPPAPQVADRGISTRYSGQLRITNKQCRIKAMVPFGKA